MFNFEKLFILFELLDHLKFLSTIVVKTLYIKIKVLTVGHLINQFMNKNIHNVNFK